jgi:hypothetical protein
MKLAILFLSVFAFFAVAHADDGYAHPHYPSKTARFERIRDCSKFKEMHKEAVANAIHRCESDPINKGLKCHPMKGDEYSLNPAIYNTDYLKALEDHSPTQSVSVDVDANYQAFTMQTEEWYGRCRGLQSRLDKERERAAAIKAKQLKKDIEAQDRAEERAE